jgi:hypothetical protein
MPPHNRAKFRRSPRLRHLRNRSKVRQVKKTRGGAARESSSVSHPIRRNKIRRNKKPRTSRPVAREMSVASHFRVESDCARRHPPIRPFVPQYIQADGDCKQLLLENSVYWVAKRPESDGPTNGTDGLGERPPTAVRNSVAIIDEGMAGPSCAGGTARGSTTAECRRGAWEPP